ncbi:MAG: hypothetical protein L3J18_04535 [Candidatus Brocadia sp.]|jgi:Uncharacterized protein predicted to be involved in DNA repair (RAMP superfamily)|nr:MAG: hypothetical protein L3J18_04535 [Candidatus Brocadia sp.]
MPDYFVRPYDVLFFRGNKSFHFGEWYTEGVFPPYPSTFQGFVRNKLLADHHLIDPHGSLTDAERAREKIGNDETLGVDITGPYLMDADTGEIYFKTPSDLFRKNDGDRWCYSAFPIKMASLESDCGFDLCCPTIPDGKLDDRYPPEFISLSEICRYRLSLNEMEVAEKGLWMPEDRVGITLDTAKLREHNRTVEETKFYTTPYNRLRDRMGFYCATDKPLAAGALKLGSESHLVYVSGIASDSLLEQKFGQTRETLISEMIKTKTFRMALLQHGIFEQGWIPFRQKEEKKNLFEADGLHLELLFAFTRPPLRVSGYSFEKNTKTTRQQGISLKPLKNAVPAGAVYLFRLPAATSDEAIRKFVQDYDNRKLKNTPYSSMGFNHVVLANGHRL